MIPLQDNKSPVRGPKKELEKADFIVAFTGTETGNPVHRLQTHLAAQLQRDAESGGFFQRRMLSALVSIPIAFVASALLVIAALAIAGSIRIGKRQARGFDEDARACYTSVALALGEVRHALMRRRIKPSKAPMTYGSRRTL